MCIFITFQTCCLQMAPAHVAAVPTPEMPPAQMGSVAVPHPVQPQGQAPLAVPVAQAPAPQGQGRELKVDTQLGIHASFVFLISEVLILD